jgi:hypothetical protein
MKKQLSLFILFILATALPLRSASTVAALSSAKAYPNPWRSDKNANSSIRFDGMPAGSVIKIFTISAHEVNKLIADSSGVADWTRTNSSGDPVASGIYIYLIIDPQGNEASGKLAIIK